MLFNGKGEAFLSHNELNCGLDSLVAMLVARFFNKLLPKCLIHMVF